MAKKQNVLGGLSGLLNTPPQAPKPTTSTPQAPVQDQEPPRGTMKAPRGTTVRVCYNLDKDLVVKVKKIAKYDRKNINEIYTEALQAYIDSWTPTPQEPPQL